MLISQKAGRNSGRLNMHEYRYMRMRYVAAAAAGNKRLRIILGNLKWARRLSFNDWDYGQIPKYSNENVVSKYFNLKPLFRGVFYKVANIIRKSVSEASIQA